MRNQILGVLLAAGSHTVLTAQQAAFGGPAFDGFAAPAPSTAEFAGGAGERMPGSPPIAATELFRRRGIDDCFAPAPQETDYSPRGLFLNAHGDFMMRRERYKPMVEVRGRTFPNYEIKGESGTFDLLQFGGDIQLPLTISPDAYITAGAYYDQRRYSVQGMAPGFDDENLIAAGVHLGFGVFVDENVMLEVLTSPGLWSDLDGSPKHQDYDFPSSALITWRTSDDVFLKFGVRYNQVFNDAPWLPILGIGWAISEHFRLDIEAPEHIEMSWWPDAGFGVLFGSEITGAEYRVQTDKASGAQRDNLHVQEVIVYGGAVWRCSDAFSLKGRVGMTVAGDYDLTTGAASPPLNRAEGTLEQGLFAEVSFGFDF